MKNKIMVVFGTRPEAIKMCPLIKELKNQNNFETKVCVTGQHKEMLQQVLDVFKIVPDYNLAIMKDKQSLFDVTTNILNKIKSVLEKEKPNIILVHGDTSTTFVVSLAAFYLNIPVGHVEAGLRTYDLHSPFPEEFNRQATSLIAKFHFAPTQKAKQNLLNEHKNEKNIFITGNTAIDALNTTIKPNYFHPLFDWVGNDRLILLTAHRRENLGEPLHNMFRAINRIVQENDDIKVIYPIHFNPIVRETADKIFKGNERIKIIEPLSVLDFHNFMNKAYLILTDSGGIQEEAPSLGKPVLVMRNTTERPEGIEAGTLKLVGTEEKVIYQEFNRLLNDQKEYDKMSKASNPYGNGTACKQISSILAEYFSSEK